MKTIFYTIAVGLMFTSCASLQGTNVNQSTVSDDIYYTPGDEKVNDSEETISQSNSIDTYENFILKE